MEDAHSHLGKGASGFVQLFPQLTQEEGFSLLTDIYFSVPVVTIPSQEDLCHW